MLKLGRFYYTSRGFDLLQVASSGKHNVSFTLNKIMKQLAFLIVSFTPCLKNIAQISSHSFWPNQLNFTVFCIYLTFSELQEIPRSLDVFHYIFQWHVISCGSKEAHRNDVK